MSFYEPIFIVYADIVKQNIKQMLAKANKNNVVLRPHFKTHQSIEIGNIFKDFGISKITVSSLEMAYFFANNSWNDITIAFPINFKNTKQINALAKKIRLNIIISTIESINFIAELSNINFLIEIDTGYNRTGFSHNNFNDIEASIKEINKNNKFIGFLNHSGNTYSANNTDKIITIYNSSKEKLQELQTKFTKYKPIISVGDTPSCSIIENFEGINEIRPGNFVYYDLMQYNLGVCTEKQIGAVLYAPIIAMYPERNQMVIHAGAVHLSKEYISYKGKKCYGLISKTNKTGIEIIDGVYISSLSQEHGIITFHNNKITEFKLYETIAIIPVHSCLTANLMKHQQEIL